ncbi:MAG: CocE/NonD family hydrolase, partial [Candidatus Thermoplasmatota archaeon]
MHTGRALLLLALLSFAALSGCFGGNDDDDPATGGATGLVPVQDRHLQPFKVTDSYSHTLLQGVYGILDGLRVDVPVDLPLTEGGNAITGDATMNLGLFLPDIPGCDWTAATLPDHCKVPVVADAGPYYAATVGIPDLQGDCQTVPDFACAAGEGDTISTEPAHRLGGFLIENLVPHGYAVAQVSVFGTGDSNHCMDLMGDAEQAGLDAAVTWLGSQPWSNGRVALTGRSYDGSTPWEAAMFGNPHLATIVPISGLTSQFDLMYHNGSSESRGAGLLYGIYAAMTVDGEPADGQQVLCPDYLTGSSEGLKATLAGNPTDADPYWAERIFLDRALANYKGSIYLIHGLQDWNVEPHMAFPAYNQFEANGNEVKALLGQWGHMYPDRPGEHAGLGEGRGAEAYPESVRYDWAQDMLEWFDYTLKQTGPKPAMHVEVQDNQGSWRVESTWPPLGERLDVGVALQMQTPGEPQWVTAADTRHFDLGVLNENG